MPLALPETNSEMEMHVVADDARTVRCAILVI